MTDEVTARSRVRTLIEETVGTGGEVQVPVVAAQITETLKADRQFVEAYAAESLPSMVYEEVRRYLAYSRGITTSIKEEFDAKVEEGERRFKARFSDWMEHTGDRHVHLMDMTKADLRTAISERTTRGNREFTLAALWGQLDKGLKKDQRVGDKFTPEQIDGLYQNIVASQEGATA